MRERVPQERVSHVLIVLAVALFSGGVGGLLGVGLYDVLVAIFGG